jgi:uncharacterized C2H2 Zn-finger protein
MAQHNRFDIYLRQCKRCGELFKTKARTGRICNKCKLPPWWQKNETTRK